MSAAGSDRLDFAKAIPIMELADRLAVVGLRRNGHEHTGPCPVCGGKDRFSINPAMNVFNCRICARGGDQVALVELVHGCEFKEALAYLAGELTAQVDPAELARRREVAQKKEADRVRYATQARKRAVNAARNIWSRAIPAAGTLVEQYLKLRGLGGLESVPPSLRFIADHPFFVQSKSGRREIHRGPCMIAGVQASNGKVRAVHQTWIDLDQEGGKVALTDGEKSQPSKKVLGSKKGGAIRLSKMITPLVLVMGEGIETTLTAMQAAAVHGATYWAGVDLGNMAGRQVREIGRRNSGLPDLADLDAFVPPAGTEHLIFIQDGDSAAKATEAKLLAGCRRAMALRPGLTAKIVHPGDGVDLNDLIT